MQALCRSVIFSFYFTSQLFHLPAGFDHGILVHSSSQCDNVSEKAMHYIGRRRRRSIIRVKTSGEFGHTSHLIRIFTICFNNYVILIPI